MKKILTAFVICSVLVPFGCRRAPAPGLTQPNIQVTGTRVTFAPDGPQPTGLVVATVEPRATAERGVTGRLVWDEDTTVRIYSPVAGRVREAGARLGDHVEAGAALARLESPDFGQAQADVRKASADQLLAERTLARARELAEHGAVARKDVEVAENGLANAQAEQQRATARLAPYGGAGGGAVDGLFTLKSPVAGTIVEKNLNVGQELRPDLMLANAPQLLLPQFVISEPRRLWVLLDVTESDMALLKRDLRLRITSRALPDHVFSGQLEVVGESLEASTRTVRARGSVENTNLLLKAEMYVDVELEAEPDASGAVAIAGSAVFSKDDRSYVFVEAGPGAFERREVRIGAESAGKILVRDGLKAGERVLVEGGLLLEAELESGGRS
jgi:cobalt-zinc-cadmium efflux system membrane fusion protein